MSITPAEANLRQQAAASVATSEAALAPSSFDGVPKMFTSPAIWWYLTAVYFGYVTLGGFSPSLHEHIYTGNASDPVLDRIIAGQFVTFSKPVYRQYFFPAFLRYHGVYAVHVLGAGVWLVTGVYNLRSAGPAATKMPGRPDAPITARRHRAVGYVYACTSFAKGMTALLLSIYSHSLGYSRPFLAMFAVWDMLTLFVATNHAIRRRFRAHRCWMIRNFSAGAGSIWVRVFGAVWAACDLSFMDSPAQYGRMNDVVLVGGFSMGILFGEWWLARVEGKDQNLKARLWFFAMILNCISTAILAVKSYTDSEDAEATSFSFQEADHLSEL